MPSAYHQTQAHERYNRSVGRAQIRDLLGLITGSTTDLVEFDEVARRLKARQQIEKGTQMVPLDKIVGSVGRYRDFTREFLPRPGVNRERWARLDAAMNSLENVPPVELYRLGDVYFVKDGNHRVSVARANDLSHIEAYVAELETPIPLTLDDFERDQWIMKVEHAGFLEQTRLDTLRPDHNLLLTAPGNYEIILHHIEVHGYFRDLELERQGETRRLSWEEKVCSWYDTVYMPVVEAIRRDELLAHFPGRTEADLYLWIAKHRERLAQRYGLAPLDPDTAVSTFAETHSDRPVERMLKGLRLGLHRALHGDDRPLGMSDEEFQEYRARHDAGELSVSEAEELESQMHDTPQRRDVR